MALTLTESNKLSNDVLRNGVIETVIRESPVLQYLPFIEVLGTGLTYNREVSVVAASFYAVGDTWAEATPTFTQVTATLAILGGDADIDNFLARTRSNLQDVSAAILELKSKSVAHQFEDTFIYGSTVTDVNSFNGLHLSIPSGQQVHVGSGATPGALSLASLDQMLDLIRPGKPDIILTTRRTRRLMGAFSRSATGPFLQTVEKLGYRVDLYNGMPFLISDFMTDTETIAAGVFTLKTGGASASMMALKFGEDAVVGIQGSNGIEVEDIGSLETKDARRFRIKWYCNFAIFNTISTAKLDGMSSGAITV